MLVDDSEKLVEKVKKLDSDSAGNSIEGLISQYLAVMPKGTEFGKAHWDIQEWNRSKVRSKTMILDFSDIKNQDLLLVVKIYLLDLRFRKNIAATTVKSYLNAIKFLGKSLGQRRLNQIISDDFFKTERIYEEIYSRSTAVRMAGYIVAFANWLNIKFGLRIDYSPSMESSYIYGRKAVDDESRALKLISSHVIADLLNCLQSQELDIRDRFFISVIALLLPTGFRMNELLTLHKDCLVYDDELIGIRAYSAKKCEFVVRPIIRSYADVVVDAIRYITEITEPGRKAVEKMQSSTEDIYDWSFILRDRDATRYFVKKFAHKWTSSQDNYLFTKRTSTRPDGNHGRPARRISDRHHQPAAHRSVVRQHR